jgi:anti-anti-sigma factor
MASGSHLIVATYGGVTVVSVDTSVILDPAQIAKMSEELYQLVDDQARGQIIIDFAKVRMLSSQAIGMLLSLRKKSEAIKGEAVLCGIRPDLHKIFKITQIDKLFKFFDTEKAALAHFDVHLEG